MSDGLLHKIEAFVKKFYLNRLVQGVLVGAVLWMAFFLLINGLEYFSWFPSKGRFVLFLFLMLGSVFVLVYHFLIPLFNLIRFRKKMSVQQAAALIGKFFPDIQDKLLNTIQLEIELKNDADNQLLAATIEQRTAKLSPIRFSDAVDLRANLKYLGYFLGVLAIVLFMVVFFPSFGVQPTKRIVNFGQDYEKPLPYRVEIQSYAFETSQGSDLTFNIVVTGERIPDAFFVKSDLGQQLMTKNSTNNFCYTFKNLYDDLDFQVFGGDFMSQLIHVSVHPNPILLSYRAELCYPAYIHRESETIESKTRLLVPQGTCLRFDFLTRDVQTVFVEFDSLSYNLDIINDHAVYQFVASSLTKFSLHFENEWNSTADPIRFVVDIIPDAYPDIRVESFDEQLSADVFFSGLVTDDYGFSKLTFNCLVKHPFERKIILPIALDGQQTRTSFFYHFNMDSLGLLPGQDMEVFFEIWDNDGFHGPKSKRSQTFTYCKLSEAALDSIADHSAEDLADRLRENSHEAQKLDDDIEKMLQELTQKKDLDWADKEKMKDLIEKQKQIQEDWNQLQKEQQQLSEFMKEHEIVNEDLLEKQEQINKLFEEVITDEMKKMMDELQKMLEEMPREQMQKMMQDIKKNNQSMQEMLDRNLNLLEQLKMEKDIVDLAEKLKELGEELRNDADKEGEKSVQEARDVFKKLMDDLEQMVEKNQSLANPLDLDKDEEMESEINEDLEQAVGSEQSGEQQKSQQKKQSAGQKMQQMANNLLQQMQGGGMEQLAEDAQLMRVLLENVVHASHQQEQLMLQIGTMRTDDPSLVDKIIRQKDIANNFDMVRDSLRAMAMRQPAVQNFVFDELHIIDNQTDLAMNYLNELHLSQAVRNQQTAMMSMNNLALMLAESLEQMENSMEAEGMPMNGGNPKPGKKSGGKSLQQMQQMQQQLGEQLKKMQEQMKNGQQEQGGMSEELARMAAEQEMLRQGMQKLLEEMKQNGQVGDDGLNQIIKDMEKLEEDLVNKRVTRQTLQRNQEILSRMLESQKAQEKRDQDEQRKSNEYKGNTFERVIDELLYQQHLKQNQDFLKTRPIEFTPYYKTKINEYYLKKNTQTK